MWVQCTCPDYFQWHWLSFLKPFKVGGAGTNTAQNGCEPSADWCRNFKNESQCHWKHFPPIRWTFLRSSKQVRKSSGPCFQVLLCLSAFAPSCDRQGRKAGPHGSWFGTWSGMEEKLWLCSGKGRGEPNCGRYSQTETEHIFYASSNNLFVTSLKSLRISTSV
jgi:hypothetical protein